MVSWLSRAYLFCALLVAFAETCNVIIRVKSDTDTPFDAQVVAPNGDTSEKQSLKRRDRLTYQIAKEVCDLGKFQIKIFKDGKEVQKTEVSLQGTGNANYVVKDDLMVHPSTRHGLACTGACAPLSATRPPRVRETVKSN